MIDSCVTHGFGLKVYSYFRAEMKYATNVNLKFILSNWTSELANAGVIVE